MILPTIERNAVNDTERERARTLRREIAKELPQAFNLKRRSMALGATALAAMWNLRVRVKGDMIQPATIVTRLRSSARQPRELLAPALAPSTN